MKTKTLTILLLTVMLNHTTAQTPWRQFDISGFRNKPLDLGNSNNINVNINEKKERSVLEDISLQIQKILYNEMQKYSNFYYDNQSPRMSIPNITDTFTDENGNQVIVGEYTYNNDYYRNNQLVNTPKRSFLFRATIKQIFDNYTVKKIIYKSSDDWYRLFPQNEESDANINSEKDDNKYKSEGKNTMRTNKDACLLTKASFNSDYLITIPKYSNVQVIKKVDKYYLVNWRNSSGYIYENSLE